METNVDAANFKWVHKKTMAANSSKILDLITAYCFCSLPCFDLKKHLDTGKDLKIMHN